MNKIVAENLLVGTPSTQWDVVGIGSETIQGYATDISVNVGETVFFKVKTDASAYRLDVYRMGYYGGTGARHVTTVMPSAQLPQVQPGPALDASTGLLDYGAWAVSAMWPVPPDATSGIYFAKLVREDGVVGASHVVFVVRDDGDQSSLLFQTSDTTWQAYNSYGDACLYEYLTTTNTRARKVSYNRPFSTRGAEEGANWVFNAEYPMVRWLEANGYDVTYCAGVDTDRRGENLLQHRVFLSVGHDEYWSARQRAQVEAARDAGVHLAFLSGNELFWKVRWENSIDGSATPYRTLVCYKETSDAAKTDPTPEWTGAWRDSRFSPPSDGGRPENALTGTIFVVQGFSGDRVTVPAEDGRLRFWRDTDISAGAPGSSSNLSAATLGYEWDADLDNGARPPGLMRLSATTVSTQYLLQGLDLTFGKGSADHHLTLYRHPSGALVFGAGTVQWSWALDGTHLDGTHFGGVSSSDARAEQAMVNLFADMGAQPASLRAGLRLATATTDSTPPTSVITSPSDGDVLMPGDAVTISGTASDADGAVGAVEVSADGGLSWHPAQGREAWTYSWTPSGNGVVQLLSRAVDDSGNLEAPSPGIIVSIGPPPPLPAPGGPVLVLVNGSYSANPFGKYLHELLRSEGIMLFSDADLATLAREADPAAFLDSFPVVLLAETPLLGTQEDLLRDYVARGGALVAMRPDPRLADVFGLIHLGRRNEADQQFFAIDTTTGPGVGITPQSLQYHGAADAYMTDGAVALASLWESVTTPSSMPAVTRHTFGSGQSVAFAFDLAKSIVLMRQGNPEWADSEGDAVRVQPGNTIVPDEYRPMDMFARLDGRMWFAPERLAVPQADEQQRFLGHVIADLLGHPIPRVWYLPGTHQSLIVNTGDTCYSTEAQRTAMLADAATHDARVTLYLWDSQIQTDVNPTTEATWRNDGHDAGIHAFAVPTKYGDQQLRTAVGDAVTHFHNRYAHTVRSARNHTIDWVGWISPARFEAELGIELDLNYYHYWNLSSHADFPQMRLPTSKQNACGYFTGSGLPQRFCDENGTILPVFQLLTEWPDEFFADNGFSVGEVTQIITSMLASAHDEYPSAFAANIHPVRYAGIKDVDEITGPWARALWEYAHDNDIPVWTAARFLDFTAARQSVTFDNLSFDGTTLQFDFSGPAASDDVTVVLPADDLTAVSVGGEPVTAPTGIMAGRSVAFLTSMQGGAHVIAHYA